MSDLRLKPARIAYPNLYSDCDDYAVTHDSAVVGRIVKESFSGKEERWKWSFKREGANGYELGQTGSLEEAMTAFRRAWNERA